MTGDAWVQTGCELWSPESSRLTLSRSSCPILTQTVLHGRHIIPDTKGFTVCRVVTSISYCLRTCSPFILFYFFLRFALKILGKKEALFSGRRSNIRCGTTHHLILSVLNFFRQKQNHHRDKLSRGSTCGS